ncbi:hypothetical protein RP20_CCG009006 [Aedes albopictus]|nr:hypothetical protein RP20_CCG009006 [Aedes albopictus]
MSKKSGSCRKVLEGDPLNPPACSLSCVERRSIQELLESLPKRSARVSSQLHRKVIHPGASGEPSKKILSRVVPAAFIQELLEGHPSRSARSSP